MFEFLKLGLSIQKNLIDAQVKQLEAAEQLLRAGQSQVGSQAAGADAMKKLAEQQRNLMNSWLGLWGMRR